MEAQPKFRPSVASPAREVLPLRTAVMLTPTVCSLLRPSLLLSRLRRCFLLSLSVQHIFKLPNLGLKATVMCLHQLLLS